MTATAAAALAQYCPDLPEWPERWMGDETDIAVGQRIVEFFKPFLLHMISEKLATKTLHRHRDHLWLLGGELIKRRYDDHQIKRMSVEKAIVLLIQACFHPKRFSRAAFFCFFKSSSKPTRRSAAC